MKRGKAHLGCALIGCGGLLVYAGAITMQEAHRALEARLRRDEARRRDGDQVARRMVMDLADELVTAGVVEFVDADDDLGPRPKAVARVADGTHGGL